MIIIGEKINGAIPSVGRAIAERDAQFIKNLAVEQEKAGANYLDVCAGTAPELEYDAMVWLIETVQEVATKPLCIDSPDPEILKRVMPLVKTPGIVNSISMEGNKCEVLLPLLKDNDWQVVALACDSNGIAEKAEDKTAIAVSLIEKAAEYGVTPDRIHIDPLVLALSAINDSSLQFCQAIRDIKKAYPTVKITAALSNISYGMPNRKLVNSHFLAFAMEAGLDSVIGNPMNKDMIGTIYATEAILGKDRLCRRYNSAYRAGKI